MTTQIKKTRTIEDIKKDIEYAESDVETAQEDLSEAEERLEELKDELEELGTDADITPTLPVLAQMKGYKLMVQKDNKGNDHEIILFDANSCEIKQWAKPPSLTELFEVTK